MKNLYVKFLLLCASDEVPLIELLVVVTFVKNVVTTHDDELVFQKKIEFPFTLWLTNFTI